MIIDERAAKVDASGVYDTVMDVLSAELEIYRINRVQPSPVIGEVLERMRKREQVSVPRHYLPKSARAGRSGMADLWPDDRIMLRDGDWAEMVLWLGV